MEALSNTRSADMSKDQVRKEILRFQTLTINILKTFFTTLSLIFLGDELPTDDASPPRQLVGEVDDLFQGEGSTHRAL